MSKRKKYDLGIHQWILQFPKDAIVRLLKHLNLSGIGIIHEISSPKQLSEVRRQIMHVTTWQTNVINKNESERFIFHNLLIKHDEKLKQSSIKKILTELRPRVEIVTMECTTPSLTKWALNDRRIDIVTFPPSQIKHLVDASTARISKEHNKYVELPLSHFLRVAPSQRILTLRQYMEVFQRLRKKKTRIIVTSRARDPLELRNPVQIRSFLKTLGFTESEAREIVSANPNELIQKNLEKLSPKYILPGMKAVTLEEIVEEMLRTQTQPREEEEE